MTLKKAGFKLHRLGNHFAIGQEAPAQHPHLRQRSSGVQNPERRVFQVAACAQPFVGFVNRRQRVAGGVQELDPDIALADRPQPLTERGDVSPCV